MAFHNGFRMVQLLTKQALVRETAFMSHCIGNGAYNDYIPGAGKSGNYIYYSLRDDDNKPHVTMEVDFERRRLIQCKGKGNVAPIAKYISYVGEFIVRAKLKQSDVLNEIGLIVGDGKFYNVHEMPDSFTLESDLDVFSFENFKFPKSLRIKGNLTVSDKQVSLIPEDLKFDGKLIEYHQKDGVYYKSISRKKKNGIVRSEGWYNEQYEWHREGAPAVMQYYPKGCLIQEVWYHCGKLHREDGPAITIFDATTGKIKDQSWWVEGKPQPKIQAAA